MPSQDEGVAAAAMPHFCRSHLADGYFLGTLHFGAAFRNTEHAASNLPEFNLQIVVQHELLKDTRQAFIMVFLLPQRPFLYVTAPVPRLSVA